MAEVPKIFNQPGATFAFLRSGQKFPPIQDGSQLPENAHTFAQAHKGNVVTPAGNGYIVLNQDEPAIQPLNCAPGGFGLTGHEVYHMRELDEVLGPLNGLEEADGCWLLAKIGKISVLLPAELHDHLQNRLGKRIGVLRLDGYRVRCLDDGRA